MGGDGGSEDWSSNGPHNTTVIYKIGIYGWRKRCMYVFLLLMMVSVIVNMALTIWILKVMDFSVHGMGQLRITSDGVRVEGDSEFIEGLYTSSVKSKTGAALKIESARNITLNARNKNNEVTDRLVIGNGRLQSYSSKFEIYSGDDTRILYADKNKVEFGASTLHITDPNGAVFRGSVQTPHVKSFGEDLRIESPTRSLLVTAPEGVRLEAQQGPINISSSFAPLNLESLNQVVLEGKSVRLKSLKVSQPQVVDSPFQEVYQLCICESSNKLFLASSRGNCQATGSICD